VTVVHCGPSGIDQVCATTDDCNAPYETCNTGSNKCEHKEVFPLELMEFFGSVSLGILIALCNAGGIGGGEIIVPAGMIFFVFSTKEAVALSNFCIFAASLTRFIINFNLKHPMKDAKVIDYSIVMVMFPMVLLGSTIGIQISGMLPDGVILIGESKFPVPHPYPTLDFPNLLWCLNL
jgi:hypothetical protein